MIHSIDLADHRMVAMSRSTLAALRSILFRDAGPAAAGARARFDRHVGNRHTAFHRQVADRFARKFDRVARAARGAGGDGPDPIAEPEYPFEPVADGEQVEVGKVTKTQVAEIAKTKLPDLNAADLPGAVRIVEGTARSMGIEVI